MTIPSLKELVAAGAHFGHRKALSHPRAAAFIFGIKNGINIINLEVTQQKLTEVFDVITKLTKAGKTILFVGTKRQAKNPLVKTAKACKMPWVDYRWLGGTLTNFGTIKKRIKYYLDLENKLSSEEAKNYTKKERTMWQKELNRLAKFFEGLRNLAKTPDILFVVGAAEELVAITEANKAKVPVIALGSTDTDPNKIDCFVPINDNSERAIELVCKLVEQVVEQEKSESKIPKDKVAEDKNKIENSKDKNIIKNRKSGIQKNRQKY